MALQCQMTVNRQPYQAGGTPPQATLQVYNPNAVAVTVTGLELGFTDDLGNTIRPVVQPSVPPIGIGQTTTVPALSSIFIGPFPMTFGSVAAGSQFDAVPPSSQPSNSQGSQPLQQAINIGGLVYGSDGSVNVMGKARVFMSYTVPPPPAFQGGSAQFNGITNSNLVAVGVG